MNIFILDLDPKKAAEFLCDKHLSKMCLETTQLAYTAHFALDGKCNNESAYKPTHINHPCSLWARESLQNYKWLISHGLSICDEYEKTYNKTHKCKEHLLWLKDNVPKNIANNGLTNFAMAFYKKNIEMYNMCYVANNPVDSYRNYYFVDKKRFAKWKKRQTPEWWGKKLNEIT